MQEYFKNMFINIDPNIKLDEDQIKIITTNEKYQMVIAGAGAGKTTTICAKVNYLIEKLNIKDEEILIISFTNKAIEELKERINNDFKHNVDIMTFHKLGYKIIKENTNNPPNIIKNSKEIISTYIENNLIKDAKKLKQFIDIYTYYFDIDETLLLFKNYDKYYKYKNRQKYPTLKSKIEYIKENINQKEEHVVADYLYIHGIKYKYKQPYIYDENYIPDFTIYYENKIFYIEYFNMNKINKMKYYLDIKIIERIHKKNKTNLIKIYNENIVETLELELKKRNINIKPQNINKIFEELMLKRKEEKYKKFIELCDTYIKLFKSKGYKDFSKINKNKKRNKMIIEFIEQLYNHYQETLKKTNQIDFQDMITLSNNIIEQKEKLKLKYKYIIIDEYQDISESRFELIKNISKKLNTNIMVVGDDWQTIYSFASSNINLFTNFEKIMNPCTTQKIIKTYRNSQELIDIAGEFIQKNTKQITKKLISPKRLENPVKILTYKNIEETLEHAIEYLEKKYKNKNILILGRYTFDKNKILGEKFKEKNNKILYKEKEIDYMTIHSSKGLGYDNVIIINAINDTLGFPSKIKEDEIIEELITKDETIKYAEERRLFYVALTRTKNEVIILAPKEKESEFIKEIKKIKHVKKYKDSRKLK